MNRLSCIRYHHARNLGGIVNPMIALIQIADSMIQAPTGINVNPNLLQSLRLAPETVVEMHQQAIESFDRIKAESAPPRTPTDSLLHVTSLQKAPDQDRR